MIIPFSHPVYSLGRALIHTGFFLFFFFNLGIQTSISLQLCLKSEVKLFVEVVRDEKCYQKDYGCNEHTISVN